MKQVIKKISAIFFTSLFLSFAFISGCSSTEKKSMLSEWRFVPLPDLTKQPLKLKIVHVINDRFVSLNDEQVSRVLIRSRQLIKQHFNVEVEFENKSNISIEKFFSYLPNKIISARGQYILDAKNIDGDTKKMMNASIYSTLMEYDQQQASVIDYAKPFLIDSASVTNFTELADELVKTLLHRLKYWYQQKADDGYPVLNSEPYNQWVWWDSMGYGSMPYDVVITNQLVASIENYGMAVHSSLRGGITGGTMTYSKAGPYKGYIFISAFQLLNDFQLLETLRDDKHYNDDQIIDYMAALLTHEVGHLLFHFGHPFNDSACIMNPTPLLRYREWYDGLDEDACNSGAYPMMKPGAAKIDFNPDW